MNNPELQRAWQIIENTGTHLFLTGKAGTGTTCRTESGPGTRASC